MRCLYIAAVAGLVFATTGRFAAAQSLELDNFNWTGWYVGLSAGRSDGRNAVETTASNSFVCATCGHSSDYANASISGATAILPVNPRGFIAGAQFGYNKRGAGGVVFGFEADYQGLVGASTISLASSSNDVAGFAPHTVETAITASEAIDTLGTVRGRLGYLVTPRLLVFGTGGFAFGHVRSNTVISQHLTGTGLGALVQDFSTSLGVSQTRGGWTAGGGVEFLVARNLTLKIEDLYYDLGTATSSSQLSDGFVPSPPPAPFYFTNNIGSRVRFNGNIVRIGLSLHF